MITAVSATAVAAALPSDHPGPSHLSRAGAPTSSSIDNPPTNAASRQAEPGFLAVCRAYVWARPLSVLTMGFVLLGITIRLVRYFLCFPLWGDEACLAANFLDRGYRGLLEPLAYLQVAPIGFLWIERTAVKLFGFSEYALRLFPLLCSLASVLLFYRLAARMLNDIPLLLAVAIFSVAYYPLRHGGEVKPYASDLLAALILLNLGVEWLIDPRKARYLWVLAAAGPAALALSLPAVFVAGGLGIAFLPVVFRMKCRRCWLAYVVLIAALGVAFAALLAGVTDRQFQAVEQGMQEHWEEAFPPVASPGRLPGWLVRTATGVTFAYPVGGKNGASTATLVFFALGASAWCCRQRREMLLALLAPLVLGLAAACLHKYPFGGHARVMQYLAPSISLLMASGLALAVGRLQPTRLRRSVWIGCLSLCAALGVGMALRDLLQPYKEVSDVHSRDFARWFWRDRMKGAPLVCLERQLLLQGDRPGWNGYEAQYLCNQCIYGAPLAPLRSVEAPSTHGRTLRFVAYYGPMAPVAASRVATWLAAMSRRYDRVNREAFDVNADDQQRRERYEVFQLVAKDPRLALERRGL